MLEEVYNSGGEHISRIQKKIDGILVGTEEDNFFEARLWKRLKGGLLVKIFKRDCNLTTIGLSTSPGDGLLSDS